MFEPINRKAPEDRRSVPLDPASPPTIKLGQILQVNGTTGYAALADGGALVTQPLWAFSKTGRLDVDIAHAVTVVEAPFSARVDTDGYYGSPVAGNALKVGTTTYVGKLVVESTIDTVAKLQSIVAYCVKAPDANGVIEFKAIR